MKVRFYRCLCFVYFQATTILKYWLGGQDPLDYISMYNNPGNEFVPSHWHYVSFGLSDLHGDSE